MLQRYDGEAEMPGGLTTAAFARDPYQSTRPYDNFWGRRNLASLAYEYRPDRQRQFTMQAFYTDTLRSGYLDLGRNLTLSPRNDTVRGVETRYSQAFRAGQVRHEIGVGHRFVDESRHELRYWRLKTGGILPTESSAIDRDTWGSTRAHALFIDDLIDIGNWTVTPGLRNERIKSYQHNNLTGKRDGGNYTVLLPALSAIYHVNDAWNLYARQQLVRHGAVQQDGQCRGQRRRRAGKSPFVGSGHPLPARRLAAGGESVPDPFQQSVRKQPAEQ